MLDIMYEIPKDDNIGTVTITRAYIEGKGGPKIEIRSDYADSERRASLPMKEEKPAEETAGECCCETEQAADPAEE